MSGFENMVAGREELYELLVVYEIDQELAERLTALTQGSPVDCYAVGFELVYNARETMPQAFLDWAVKAAHMVQENGFHGKVDLAGVVIAELTPVA